MVIVTALCSPKHFLLKVLRNYYTFPLVTTGFFWQVLESIHKFIIELHVLQYLFLRGSNKQQRRGGIISNFTKGETYFISYNNQVLLGVIWRWSSSSCTLQRKIFLVPSVWTMKEYTWTHIWKKSLLICFENCQDFPYSYRQSRKRMMNTYNGQYYPHM